MDWDRGRSRDYEGPGSNGTSSGSRGDRRRDRDLQDDGTGRDWDRRGRRRSNSRSRGTAVPAYGEAYSDRGTASSSRDERRSRRDSRDRDRGRERRDNRNRDDRGGQRYEEGSGYERGGGGWEAAGERVGAATASSTASRGGPANSWVPYERWNDPTARTSQPAHLGANPTPLMSDDAGWGPDALLIADRGASAPQAPHGRPRRSDWECSKCRALNFARRDHCFGCGAPIGRGFHSSIPTNVLRLSGLRRSTAAEEVVLALKPFAPVKNARLAVHPTTGASLRACYAEFASVELAQHTLETARSTGSGDGLIVEGIKASLSYAAAGAPPASAAAAVAALAAGAGGKGKPSGRPPAVSASAETALKAFQGRQTAVRLAKLEGTEAGEADASAAASAAAAAARTRVDTGSGAGTGSLAIAFAGGASEVGVRVGAVNLGGLVGNEGNGTGAEGAPPEVVNAALEKKLNPPDWPQSFEEDGAAYLFDGPSGYFYESSTGVYYDPKSKLYCKDMRWHRHVPDQDPAFVPVEQEGTTSDQYPVEQNASVAATSSAETASTDAQAQAPATTNGSGVKAAAAVAASAVTPATVKRATGIGGKKQRIAFGFKGIKLAKPGAGSGAGGAVGSEEDGGGEPKGAEAVGGGVGMGGPGALAKKRRLEDLSKWNARKLEAAAKKEEDKGERDPEPLHIAPRRQPQMLTYDPPAPLLPPLPGEDEAPNPEEVELPQAESSSSVGDWVGGFGVGGVRSGGIKGRGTMGLRTVATGRGIAVAPGPVGVGGGGDGDGAAPVVVACLLCRRSFASTEMLRKHEKKSKLHKDNLAAAAGKGALV